jgi:hypothetical protein
LLLHGTLHAFLKMNHAANALLAEKARIGFINYFAELNLAKER